MLRSDHRFQREAQDIKVSGKTFKRGTCSTSVGQNVLSIGCVGIALTCSIQSASSQGQSASFQGKLIAAAPASSAAFNAAWSLYNQRKYAASADAFENLIKSSTPSARLFYFAALANREGGRKARAVQLFTYVSQHFPGSAEATNSTQALASLQPAAAPDGLSALPDSVRNALPPEMLAMLKTGAGQQALQNALKGQENNLQIVKSAEKQGVLTKTNTTAAAKAALGGVKLASPELRKKEEKPFTADDIARDGAAGIDQSRYPNCWFEASMAALAELPRGQRLIASIIKFGQKGAYVVKFPNDGKEYVITPEFMQEKGINDKAQWASILECAETQKFPENEGAQGKENDQSRLEVGLGSITGCKAELCSPKDVSPEELSSFIGGAVKSQNPIVCGTWPNAMIARLPDLVVGQHAYTIIGFDPAKNMVTFRNPHGRNSAKFMLEDDPTHDKFEQLDNGVFKMHVKLVQQYFSQICRSFI